MEAIQNVVEAMQTMVEAIQIVVEDTQEKQMLQLRFVEDGKSAKNVSD